MMEKDKLSEFMRITLAVTVKDLLDALKNKTIVSIILGVAILTLSSQALPLLLKLDERNKALVVDPSKSTVMKTLTRRDAFQLRLADSEEEMRERVSGSPEAVLGLVTPEDFAAALEAGTPVELTGYVAHWVSPGEAAALARYFEDQISKEAGAPVQITLSGEALYPQGSDLGFAGMASATIVNAVLILGAIIVPHLLLEEKETHTLDALLVSPASYAQIILGKMLAGLAYSALAGGVVLLLNASMVVHWGASLVVILLGALFSVSVGLLVGAYVDNVMTASMLSGLVIAILILPAFFVMLAYEKWHPVFRAFVEYSPGGALTRLASASFYETFPWVTLGSDVAILLLGSLLLYLLVWLRIRRLER